MMLSWMLQKRSSEDSHDEVSCIECGAIREDESQGIDIPSVKLDGDDLDLVFPEWVCDICHYNDNNPDKRI